MKFLMEEMSYHNFDYEEKLIEIILKQSSIMEELVKFVLEEKKEKFKKKMQYSENLRDSEITSPSTEETSPSTEETSPSTEEEIANIFEEEFKSRSIEEILDKGKKVGEEPVVFYSNPGGGYATVERIKEANDISSTFHKDKKIKEDDEIKIVEAFSHLKGFYYYNALIYIRDSGYTLHPVYVNGNRNPRKLYSGSVLGVSIKDDHFNFITNTPSSGARILSVIDVGGQDTDNRGEKNSDL